MTRINLVPPQCLTDKHLMAEYHELPRIFTAVRKLYDVGKTIEDVDIPTQYVLGNGHMKFFYNKLNYLTQRYKQLFSELDWRCYNIDVEKCNLIIRDAYRWCHSECFGEYTPTPEEIYLNMARLSKRSKIGSVLLELSA